MASLTINNPSLKTGGVLSFTFSGFKPKVTLNIGDDGSGLGFVEVKANGVDISGTSQVASGTVLTVQAYVYNPSIAKFKGWSGAVPVPYSPSYAGPLTFTVTSDITLTATFQTISPPPPPSGPAFPAPGTVGDGLYWYWIKFSDGSIGWDDSQDLYYNQSGYTVLAGPYASGATG